MEFVTQARYHSILLNVAFPRLDGVTFGEYDYDSVYRTTGAALQQYLWPKLKSFDATVTPQPGGGPLSDQLFSLMGRCCLMEHLELTLESHPNIRGAVKPTPGGFLACLSRMNCLRTLILRGGLADVLSREVFEHMTHLPALEYLDLPVVDDEWVQDLDHPTGRRLFPKLQAFFVGVHDPPLNPGVSDAALALLLPHLEDILALRVASSLESQSKETLRTVARARLPKVERLWLLMDDDAMVRGEDLVMLAEQAPGLKELRVPFHVRTPPQTGTLLAEGITDTVIQRLASNARNLQHFDLASESWGSMDTIMAIDGYELTHASLYHLGAMCPHLTSCSIIAQVPFESFLCNARPNLFPNLQYLDIHQGLDEDDSVAYHATADLTKKMTNMAPKLTQFRVHSDHDGDYELYNAFRMQLRATALVGG